MLIESHLHVECFSEWRDLEGIAATWDSILQVSNPCVGVFSNLDFCRAWWKAYGANRQLFCLVCKAGSEVVAIAPLYRDRKAGKWILRIIGADSDDVDGFDFIVKRGFEDKAVDALIQKLLQMRGEWSRLELNSIPSESPGLASTRTICMARGLVIQETLVSHRLINLGSSWDEYTRQLSSKMRFSLSHQPRALARKYRLTFRRSRSVTEALEWLGVLASWQQARWNTKPAGSKLEEENRQRFYAELVCSLERNHSLSFWALYADEQLAALELGCTSGRRYLGIHQAFRPDLTASSPNLVLRAFLMQHLIEHGFEQYDFGAGDETYKVRLSNELRHYSNFCCAPRWSRSGVHIMLSNSCDSARQTLKRTLPPAAVRLARSIRKRVNDILQINMHKGANCMHRFPALLYHHVGPSYPGANRALTISPEVFRRQMERLARWGYTGIRPADWIEQRESSVSSPSKPILITFDDAYEDLSRFALPVLAELGFSAGIYVATGQIGQTNAWDEQKGYGTLRVMTAEQIVYWSNQGFEFGAHSRSHPDLTTLPDDRLIAEVAGSKDDLSSLLGSAVRTFAYPYGAYNERVQATVRNYYELAFTIEEGSNWPNSDPHRLRRAFISPSASAFQFAVNARFGGGMKWWRDLRSLLAIRTRARRIAKAIFS